MRTAILISVLLAACGGGDSDPNDIVDCRGTYTLNDVRIEKCEAACRDVPPVDTTGMCGSKPLVVEVDGMLGYCDIEGTGAEAVVRWIPCE